MINYKNRKCIGSPKKSKDKFEKNKKNFAIRCYDNLIKCRTQCKSLLQN